MSCILGINAYHGDSAACLVLDGRLVAAAEEERFRRVKHWAGFPSEAVRYCLEEGGLTLSDLTDVAINQNRRANFWRKSAYSITNAISLRFVLDRIKNTSDKSNVVAELEKEFSSSFNGKLHFIEHHLAHLSSAFHVSPFDSAAVVSIDGFGDFSSAAWGIGEKTQISIDNRIYFPHSLGIFYQALTQWLGFPNYGDEYKVMGLAPYGYPKYLSQLRKVVRLNEGGEFELDLRFFRHHRGEVAFEWDTGQPKFGALYSDGLIELLGPSRTTTASISQKHMDVARSVQAMYEEALFHVLNALHRRHQQDRLCLAGGCAMNSVANGKIYSQTPFKELYIQSAAGDAGGAIGAAFSVWHKSGGPRKFAMSHAYWGPRYSDSNIEALLRTFEIQLISESCNTTKVSNEHDLCDLTANAIAQGRVVGWFQGRMEWGPRSLGNRSILGDPRRADMKDILNLKIKRRESFRPFAPSILSEYVKDWFEFEDDVPFMMQVYPIRSHRRAEIPAVTHVDGTGRLQTVKSSSNPLYYQLIETFRKKTGVPILLNTSFNENEPVVCNPKEALSCFLRTNMDILVLGNWFIERTSE